MADWGLKISTSGKNIDSTEPRDYVFNSKYGTVKIVKEPTNREYGTITVNAASNATVSIEHGQAFPPMVMVFTELKPGSGHWYNGAIARTSPSDASGAVTMDNAATPGTYVDGTYIKIKYFNAGGSNLTVKYYYFVFGEDSA